MKKVPLEVMQALDLPPFEAKLTQSATNQPLIWDGLRRKHVVLTPEEWVRQHVVHYLTDHLGYPRGLLALERGLRYNQRQKRTDLLALNPEGQPLLLVECKAPSVPITQAVARQATTYNQTIGAPLLLLTNGLVHYCWRVDFASRTNVRLEEVPAFVDAVRG
ncbi:type I restriction enzyme HsdR N-terminal domain-containing protein [Hymenobacter armeniacus]|nr:type I restriction enzyme HsdR N-terminal domain-containing protein [Hymenobacter armeniacus]